MPCLPQSERVTQPFPDITGSLCFALDTKIWPQNTRNYKHCNAQSSTTSVHCNKKFGFDQTREGKTLKGRMEDGLWKPSVRLRRRSEPYVLREARNMHPSHNIIQKNYCTVLSNVGMYSRVKLCSDRLKSFGFNWFLERTKS